MYKAELQVIKLINLQLEPPTAKFRALLVLFKSKILSLTKPSYCNEINNKSDTF